MPQSQAEQRNRQLLEWYEIHKRNLPFRLSKDPYQIWISEIMAQQTRIETMLPYYERFIQALPALPDLAACDEQELLKLWQGLGYYSRARNLKKAAQICMEKYNGQLPVDFEKLKALPGIGDYTAGAIASIAFGLKEPAVDGNVLRVFSRLYEIEADISSASVQKKMRQLVKDNLPPANLCGDFNQALMELGATICTPGTPKCEACPIQAFCRAKKSGKAPFLPYKKAAKPRRIEHKRLQIGLYQGADDWYVQLYKRKEKGLLQGFYTFNEKPLVNKKIVQVIELEDYTHVFSHVEWHMKAQLCIYAQKEADFYAMKEIEEHLPIPGAMAPFYKQIQERKEKECPKKL